MEKTLSAKTVAFLGVMLALIFVVLLIETYLFSALFGNFTPAALTIPLAISVAITGKKWRMFVGGTLLGVASFILAIIIANPIFLNPLISILPRVFIGIVSYFVCVLFKKIFGNSKNKFVSNVLPYSIAGIFGTITNTLLVIPMMFLFHYTSIAAVLTTVMLVNFVSEVISAALLVPVFVKTINMIDKDKE